MEKEKDTIYELIIIGSGVAGLGAGVYASRYNIKTLIIGKEFGGETATAGSIENYPGFKLIDGFDLVANIKAQGSELGVQFADGAVTKIERNQKCFVVYAGDTPYLTNTVIFAIGTKRRRLELPNEKELTGRGVHYCATCDGPVYRDRTIAIAGGGDASIKGANLSAEYVKKIYLIVRGDKLIAEPINLERFEKLGDKVEVLYNTEVKEIIGKEKLEKLILSKPYNGSAGLNVDGLFVEIGAVPQTKLAESLGVAIDERGYIEVDNMMRTNIGGVFAAGDIVNHFGDFKQAITAAATGAVAATAAYNYRKLHGELCPRHMIPIEVVKRMKEVKSR